MNSEAFRRRHLMQWHALWRSLTGQAAESALPDALVRCYGEPHRHYHSLQHLDACLDQLPALLPLAAQPDEIRCALWFHDAIYQIGAGDNELRSAEWARDALLAADAPKDVAQRVFALVMATRHDAVPQSRDQEVLLDVDLGILGTRAAVFDTYEQQIRAEYQSVPAPQFRANRRRILQGFLARERIYHTSVFFARYEGPARANLARSIAALAD
jgi:predicted metal-dependent HD superfamily phosphohydrolase